MNTATNSIYVQGERFVISFEKDRAMEKAMDEYVEEGFTYESAFYMAWGAVKNFVEPGRVFEEGNPTVWVDDEWIVLDNYPSHAAHPYTFPHTTLVLTPDPTLHPAPVVPVVAYTA